MYLLKLEKKTYTKQAEKKRCVNVKLIQFWLAGGVHKKTIKQKKNKIKQKDGSVFCEVLNHRKYLLLLLVQATTKQTLSFHMT